MRKLFIAVIFAFFATSLFAQEVVVDDPDKKVDFGFDIFYDIWKNLPDGMKTKGLGFGNSLYVTYEQHIWKKDGRFRIALGGGITTHKLSSNMYLDSIAYTPIHFKPIDDDVDFKKSKLVVNYLDFLAEVRYKSPSKFRFALGLKVGFRVNSHTTYKGQHLAYNEDDGIMYANGVEEKVKYKDVQFLDKIRVGPTLKIGYRFFNVNVFYSLSKLFSEENGPQIYPISIGVTFNPY